MTESKLTEKSQNVIQKIFEIFAVGNAMINGKTYYEILGVLPDAEQIVIKAAYRALSQKYHPDKWSGDPEISHGKMSEVNLAYETLSNEELKNIYDAQINESQKFNQYHSESTIEDIFQEYYSSTESDWKLAAEYFPDIEEKFKYLKKINYSLAFAFRQVLLEKKCFDDSQLMFENYKARFLTRYFGDGKDILKFAEMLILNNFKDAAIELNKVMKVLGDIKNPDLIIEKIKNKFPEVARKLDGIRSYKDLGLYETKKINGFLCVFFSDGESAIIVDKKLRIYDSEKNMQYSLQNHKNQNMFSTKGLLRIIDIAET